MTASANLALAVDHPAISDLVRPWRTATLVATSVAAMELVLLVVAGVALLGKSLAARVEVAPAKKKPAVAATAAAKPTTPRRKPPRKPSLPRAKTRVLVLNGNGLTGAAGAEAALVQGRGYRVAGVGNAPRTDYARSLVIYKPRFRAEALRLARDLDIRIAAPLDGMRASDLGRAHLAVIVGRD